MIINTQDVITVIIPIYNGEKYLDKTLESVLASTYNKLEVLLIDDGSDDGSRAICQSYEQQDARVRYIYQKNKGIVAARNRGIDEATGKYICFCDQDDIVDSSMYGTLAAQMQMHQAQVGICSTGKLVNDVKSPYEHVGDGVYSGTEINTALLYPIMFRGYNYGFAQTPFYIYGTIWKCMFRFDFIRDNHLRFHKFVNYEDDWIFVTQALAMADRVVTSEAVGYYWRVNAASKSHSPGPIEDMVHRLDTYDNYIYGYLSRYIIDKNIFEEYSMVNMSEHFVDLYKNAASIKDRKKRQLYMQELVEYAQTHDYLEKLDCIKHLRKSSFRRKAVLTAMKYIGIKKAYIVSRIVDILENWVERSAGLAVLERRTKRLSVGGLR